MSEIEKRKAEALEGAIVDHFGGQDASRGELEVRIASELLERARAEGVSLVGSGGLLAGVTRQVLQAALEAEMAEHLGYERGEAGSRAGLNMQASVESGQRPPRNKTRRTRTCDRHPSDGSAILPP